MEFMSIKCSIFSLLTHLSNCLTTTKFHPNQFCLLHHIYTNEVLLFLGWKESHGSKVLSKTNFVIFHHLYEYDCMSIWLGETKLYTVALLSFLTVWLLSFSSIWFLASLLLILVSDSHGSLVLLLLWFAKLIVVVVI